MFSNNFLKILFGFLATLLTIFIIVLFFQYNKSLNEAYKNSELTKRANVEDFAKNISKRLQDDYKVYLKNPFFIHPSVRIKIDKLLALFSGHQYAYVFVLAKDEKGKFRYIFDGSLEEQNKGEYLQKFDPTSPLWNKAIEEKKAQWIAQNSLYGLWVTYLYPIVIDGTCQMVLAFDFSAKEHELIKAMFAPISTYLLIISSLLGLFLILIYIFGYLFYKQRKKIYIDPLTGLFNRHYLNSISDSINLEENSVALIDLDHFKRINDSYGHNIGDGVLRGFALKLEEMIRPKDTLIRYGGEEFLLFISKDKRIKTDMGDTIKSIQARLSKNAIRVQGEEIFITASIGFNDAPHLNRSLNDAIDSADKMLYIAKTSGRNRVEIYKEERLEKDTVFGPREVSQALKEHRIVPYYQPIANAGNGQIAKHEMLVRMFTRDGTFIPPNEFLPNIKSNSSYREMSKFMLEKAMETIQKYKIAVSLNFDVGDFLDKTLYEQLYDTLRKNKDLTSMLTIELLEDRQVDDFANVSLQISKLQSLGVSIAIDDFGTGYSTFSYLLALNPDILKIDGFLIKKLHTDAQSKIIVDSIVRLCKQLDIKIVAEFVENDAIKHQATAMGIDFLQGYAIGKPSADIQI